VISLTAVFVVAAVCVSVEAFFSGSEIAFVSADRARLRRLAGEGDRGARMCESLLRHPEVLLATTLLGTNVATVIFSVTVTLYLLSTGANELLAVALVTPMTLLFGEVVPKTLFQQRADQLVTRIIYPLRVASLIVRPAVWFISKVAIAITRVIGGDRQRAFITRDELAVLIEAEGTEKSEITEQEREMIANVFELTEATVEAVMVPLSEVTALPEDSTAGEAALEVADKQHSRMPVYRERVDNVVGVLHVFDLLQVGVRGKDRPIGELATTPVFVPENKPAVDLLVELQGTGNQLAVVVDEYGGATGIVTIEDLLEVVVGEIEDEYDVEPSPIVAERPGVWRINGKTDVDRVNDELGLELPESDAYESLAGLILDRLKRIPEAGESIVVAGVTLRVLTASDRAIEEIQLLRRRGRK
jgi:CBS domain containing-hemolysin-like protein